ncbi:PepSY-associated TM helix domain-containing protein [Massilia sp. DWR3-1-1]|uniref:PepSY-associated TM helix domain-containing protein n=1 Tax=Massilia sp. DWR3-1-1 TaxID=2804559 RepID=UPI003CEF1CE6
MSATITPLQRDTARAPAAPQRDKAQHGRKASLIKWLRKTHGWIGLWGAALGLLFGTSGILLNHRALLKIPAVQSQESTIQVPLPTPAPRDADAMALWLKQSLAIAAPATRVKADKAKPVAWGDAAVVQPARWSAAFITPSSNVQAEYWVGNNFVSVKRTDTNAFGVISNLHKGSGMGVGWILLVDTLAGSIILLSITGVLLWALMSKKRLVGTAIGTVAVCSMLGIAAASW